MNKEELYYEPNSKTLREEPQVLARWQDPTIEMLNKKIEAQDKIINTQALEIARLKETIGKATEWVHKHISKYNCKGITIIDWDELSNPNDLLEILGDKENE